MDTSAMTLDQFVSAHTVSRNRVVGESSVILLHPPSAFSRCFNRDGDNSRTAVKGGQRLRKAVFG